VFLKKTIARIETNEMSPTIQRLAELAKILEVSVAEILEFDAKQVFNNSPNNQHVGEFNAYNAVDVKSIKELYERLLSEKDIMISELRNQLK
jgi:transcriptional regulator with XRE-family HTH domain